VLTRLFVLASRISAIVRGRRLDAEFDAEIGTHLAMLTDEHIRRGLTPAEARRAAVLEFGGALQTREDHRDRRGFAFVDTALQDLRYACRTLRRNPLSAALVVLTLAIGIGAATSIFTVVRAVLLRPLPYADPDRLIEISEVNPLKGWTHTVVAPANLADWRARNSVFTGIAAYIGTDDRGASTYQSFLAGDGETVPLRGLAVTGNLFDVLGVRPFLGRAFTWDQTFEGNDAFVILAHRTWQNYFAADPEVVGKSVVLSGRTVIVIGVMCPEFFFPNHTVQFWTPLGVKPDIFVRLRRPHWMNTVARLKPGVSIERARDEMTGIAADLERTYPDTNTKMGVRLEPLHGIMAADARPALLLLSGAVTVLFLIVCANLAGLQLGRALGRMREIAIRRALGASRRRLVRQLVTEALLLSCGGGAAGIALASAAPAALLRLEPTALPLFAVPRLDVSVIAFAIAAAAAATMLFALLPAVTASRFDRFGERTESASRQTGLMRDVLVGCEVGLAVMLVVGAVLLVRSLLRLQSVDPGFNPDHVVTFKVTLPRARYAKDDDLPRMFSAVEERLRALPGVEAVGATSTLALRGYTYTGDATVEGRPPDDYERELRHESVTPDYFRAMGIRLLAGRMLDANDGKDANVTLVNEAMVKKYFRGGEAVGRRIKFGRPNDSDPWMTIVGVVADGKQDGLDQPARPEAYVHVPRNPQNPLTFVIRSKVDAESMVAAARSAVRAADRGLALTDVTTLDDLIHRSTGEARFRTALLALFAGVALFLAALGIYGVLAWFVTLRTRELGIRLALGAPPVGLFRMVVAQGMRPVLVGAAAGVAAAIGSGRAIGSLLFDVTPLDPATYAAAVGLLAAIALGSCALPAARATKVDPLTAIRGE
jgi:putative ABC transport system permease protein